MTAPARSGERLSREEVWNSYPLLWNSYPQRAVRQGGFTHDAGAGSFLGRSVVEHGAFPVGSLVFRAADGAGFWMAQAVDAVPEPEAPSVPPTPVAKPTEKPKRERKARVAPVADAAKDKALLDAFSSAIASALHGQEAG